jgi:light-regulated signal transduction histidine kinase (bacteriophytochrome)
VSRFNDLWAWIDTREAELGEARATLEQRVEERTRQLTALNKEMEAFTYSVSHDLRAPLRHVNGFVSLLRAHAGATLDADASRYLDVIAQGASQMGRLIDDLLEFSRMGRTALTLREVELDPLVREVVAEVARDAPGRAIDWTFAALPCVAGDRALLRVALVNLLSNAVKYTRTREPARIEVGRRPDADGELVLFVKDNGVGFDMRYAAKLYGVFQRLHRAEEFEGTGIGLATVRRVVDRHGGRTWAESALGAGATFYLSLPMAQGGGDDGRAEADPAR